MPLVKMNCAALRWVLPTVLFVGIICAGVIATDIRNARVLSLGSAPESRPDSIKTSQTDPSDESHRIDTTRRHLTEKQRAELWRRLLDLPDKDAIALLLSLADRDLNAAFELALALGGLESRGDVAREALRELMERNLETALAWGSKCDPSPEMGLFWAAAIDLTAGPNPSLAFELSGNTGGDLRLALLGNIFAEWAGEDAQAARSAALTLATHEERSAAHFAMLRSELDRDLGAALAWIESLADPELQDALYYHAMPDWAAQDPAGAAQFAGSLLESDYKTHVAGMVIEAWVRSDPTSAMAWASRLPEQESREEAISRGIRHTFESSPEAAAEFSLHLPSEGERAAAIEYVVSAWIERDPATLAQWISRVPDITTRERLTQMMQDHVESIISAWSKQYPEGLANWLAQLPHAVRGELLTPSEAGSR